MIPNDSNQKLDMTANKKIVNQTFNEDFYLKKYPDVAAAVKSGGFESGWQHYLEFGFREKRRIGISDRLSITADEILPPSPPDDLVERIGGVREIDNYHYVGKNVAHTLKNTLTTESIVLHPQAKILDFGCGCGRVISWFQQLCPEYQYYGTDIDSSAVEWCQSNLSDIANFSVNPHLPASCYQDNYFDLIYSISVFTHLPEDMQFAWLAELSRITKPGGYLLLTTHDEALFPFASGEEKKQLDYQGFYFLQSEGTPGLPDFYQTTFHSRAYIDHLWQKYFEIKTIIQQGILDHQDIVVCQKRQFAITLKD
jgi:ubiquinone/menaquinone biosynthesis C-methylase UbiE